MNFHDFPDHHQNTAVRRKGRIVLQNDKPYSVIHALNRFRLVTSKVHGKMCTAKSVHKCVVDIGQKVNKGFEQLKKQRDLSTYKQEMIPKILLPHPEVFSHVDIPGPMFKSMQCHKTSQKDALSSDSYIQHILKCHTIYFTVCECYVIISNYFNCLRKNVGICTFKRFQQDLLFCCVETPVTFSCPASIKPLNEIGYDFCQTLWLCIIME